MFKVYKRFFTLLISLTVVAVLISGCEIKRTSGGQWHQLPELSKPQVSPTSDEGGEFRRSLFELEDMRITTDDPIKCVVTLWDLAYFAGGMARDEERQTVIEIRVAADKPTNLYEFEPDREKVLPWLKDSHVVFKVGLGIDDWIIPMIEEAKLENPDLVTINLTRNINLIGNLWNPVQAERVKIVDYNPWFWLNPDNMIPIADTFYQAFISLKPEKDEDFREGTSTLQHNYAIFPSQQNQLMGLQGKVLIQDVPVWPYYAQYFDLTITGTLMPDGRTAPTDDRMRALAKKAEEDNVVAIIKTRGYGGDIADRFSEMTGIPVVELVPHPRMPGAHMDDYFQQLMGNANKLLMKFRELGLKEIKVEQPAPPPQPQMDIQLSEEDQLSLQEMAERMAAEEEAAEDESGK